MNSAYSPVLAAAFSVRFCWDGRPLVTSKLTTIASGSLPQESPTESCQMPRSSAMSAHSSVTGSPQAIREWLMSSRGGSLANHSATPGSDLEPTTTATCGLQLSNASAWYDLGTHSWKTFQGYLLLDTSEKFSATWPRAGIVCAGVFYRQRNWERRISVIASGLWGTPRNSDGMKNNLRNPANITNARSRLEDQVELWPTPTVSGNHNRKGLSKKSGDGLETAVNRYATPQARDYRTGETSRWEEARKGIKSCNLNDQIGGQLNPTLVEWLMGWPIGWTDLQRLEMDKFQQWLQLLGSSYTKKELWTYEPKCKGRNRAY